MLGKLEVEGAGEVSGFTDPNERNLVSEVSITQPRVFGKGNPIKVQSACIVYEVHALEDGGTSNSNRPVLWGGKKKGRNTMAIEPHCRKRLGGDRLRRRR